MNIRIQGYLLFFALLITGCNSSTKTTEQSEEPKGIKRKFTLSVFNYGVEIYLKEDLTFINFSYSYGCVGGYRIKEVHGIYKLDSTHIRFIPQKLIWKEGGGEEHYFESKRTFDTVPYYDSDSTKIQREYWYLKKDSIEFLISESDYGHLDEFFIKSSNFIALANLYNSNAPEKLNSRVFCNRDTTAILNTLISKSMMPMKYKDMFFDAPENFKVISVKVDGELNPNFRLSTSSNSEIYKGMLLYSEEFPAYPVTIIDQKQDVIIGRGENLFYENTKLKIGTILKTAK